MNRDRPPETQAGSRDVLGAWLVCAVIVALAIGFSGDLHGAPPTTPFTAQSCLGNSRLPV